MWALNRPFTIGCLVLAMRIGSAGIPIMLPSDYFAVSGSVSGQLLDGLILGAFMAYVMITGIK